MKKSIEWVNRAYDKFDKVNEWVIIFLMAAMCVDLLAQVISRFVFGKPFTWSEELARYIFVWITLLGAAWCGRHHLHVQMTAVIKRFSDRMLKIRQVLIGLICSGTCFYLFIPACQIFASQSKLTAITLGVSLGIEYIVAPVGILMLGIQQLIDTLYALVDWEGYKMRYPQES